MFEIGLSDNLSNSNKIQVDCATTCPTAFAIIQNRLSDNLSDMNNRLITARSLIRLSDRLSDKSDAACPTDISSGSSKLKIHGRSRRWINRVTDLSYNGS